MNSANIMKIWNVPTSWLLTLSRLTANEIVAQNPTMGISRKRSFRTLQYHGVSERTGMEHEEIGSPPRLVWIGYGLFMVTALCRISLTPASETTTERGANHHIVSSSSNKSSVNHYIPKFRMKINRRQTHW
jgi:hypothetical protein